MSDDLKYGTLYQHLVHNDESIRQSAMRKLRAFISSKEPQVDEEDSEDEEKEQGLDTIQMAKIWRGLFYCFWMSDKDDIQQEFARNLACSIHLWRPYTAMTFFNAFLETMADRWSTIDHHRMNKYLSLIRRMMEAAFIYLRVYDWDQDIVNQFTEVVGYTLRQLPNSRRGLGMELVRLYLKSLTVSMNTDVYFNDINIDELIAENEYDDNISLEDIYYNQYVWRKEQRTGKEAVERFHAKKASKRENAEPLAFKYTKQGRKQARMEKGRQTNPENGKLLYTNPIAYLLNRKVKKEKTVDTPDIPVEIYNASRENILPLPDTAVIAILDVLLNCFKFRTDVAIFELLQEHFRGYWFNIIKRFIDDAECTMKGIENDAVETPDDVLGHTAGASLRSLAIFLREKATSADTLQINTKTGKVKQVNLASLSLSQYPATVAARRVYHHMADQVERFIARLIDLGVDFDDLEDRGMAPPGDFDAAEGEDGIFDPSMMMYGEEGELDDEEMARYLAAMNGEGEFADDFDQFDQEGDDDLDQEFDEDGEPIFNPNGPMGDVDFDAFEGEAFGEGEFDPSMFFGEGEFDPSMFLDGEGEDGYDMMDDEDEEFEYDEDCEEEDEDDEDEVSLQLLQGLFGASLRFDKAGNPQLTPPMVSYLNQYLTQKKMRRQAQSAQSSLTRKNTKQNVKLAAEYVPGDDTKWNYGYEGPLSDSETEEVRPQDSKKRHASSQQVNDNNNNNNNKKQKGNAPLNTKNNDVSLKDKKNNSTKNDKNNTSTKNKVDFDINKNKVKTFHTPDIEKNQQQTKQPEKQKNKQRK